MQWSLQLTPLFVLLGVVGYLALHELWTWLGSRREEVHGWAILWSLATLVFLVGRLLQRGAIEPGTAIIGSRVQTAAGLLVLVCSMLVVGAILDKPAPKTLTRVVIAAAVLQVPFILTTTWLVSDVYHLRSDLLGAEYYAPYPGELAFVPVAFVSFMALYSVWLLRTRGPTAEVSWKAVLAVMMAVFVCATNDLLMGAGKIRSIHLTEYGFVLMAISAGFYTVRRIDRIYGRLEDAVEQRTARIHAQRRELAQSEARFRQLAEAASEGIVVHDGVHILDANKALAGSLSVDVPDAIGLELSGLFVEESWPRAQEVLLGLRAGPIEVTVGRPDGSSFVAELASGEDQPSMPGRKIAVLRDITDQHELQAKLMLTDRMASLGTLAAGTAHEINNPLAYVTANVQLLEEELHHLQEELPPGRLDEPLSLVEEVITGSARVRSIVRDLRSLSRETSEVGPVDVEAIMELSLQMARNEIRHRAKLVRRVEDAPPVEGNEGKLGQVFLNLLINAAHSIAQGRAADNEIIVTIRPEADIVVIEVSDTGEGIAPDVAKRIFDPFFTTKPPGQGTGLGLAICHGIVTGFGGDISMRSTVGEGSVFRVSLPASDAVSAAPRRSRTTHRGLDEGADLPCRVLIVDDEPAVVRAMKRTLREHDVTVAHSGREALDLCEGQSYEVVLCDLMMPDLTGMELFRILTKERPELADRVIFVTGGVFSEEGRRFLDEVSNKRLEKPVDVSELRDVVRKMARQTRELQRSAE